MKKTIKQILDDMLARREYSILQVKRKLLSKGFVEESIDKIVEDYKNRGYLSNQRFGEERVYSLMRRGYGPFYVRKKLEEEGVVIDTKMFDWKEAYMIAMRKAKKREGCLLRQYLYQRGFNYENINAEY